MGLKKLKQVVKWGGKNVSFRYVGDGEKFIKARKRYGYRDICPLCKNLFDKNTTSIVLVISNQVGIPNRITHIECLKGKTADCAFRLIAEDYEESRKYADWFE